MQFIYKKNTSHYIIFNLILIIELFFIYLVVIILSVIILSIFIRVIK